MKIVLIDSGMGVLPFIKEILIQNKQNEYHILLEEEHFPLGNKSYEELKQIYDELILKAKSLGDYIFIACNTLSTFVHPSKTIFIQNILDFNIRLMPKNSFILGTKRTYDYLKSKNIPCIYSSSLAHHIEKEDIQNMILDIKKITLPNPLVLGCTHYPLINFLFSRYLKNEIYSFEKEAVATFPKGNIMKFYFHTKRKEIYEKFFPKSNIFFYLDS